MYGGKYLTSYALTCFVYKGHIQCKWQKEKPEQRLCSLLWYLEWLKGKVLWNCYYTSLYDEKWAENDFQVLCDGPDGHICLIVYLF